MRMNVHPPKSMPNDVKRNIVHMRWPWQRGSRLFVVCSTEHVGQFPMSLYETNARFLTPVNKRSKSYLKAKYEYAFDFIGHHAVKDCLETRECFNQPLILFIVSTDSPKRVGCHFAVCWIPTPRENVKQQYWREERRLFMLVVIFVFFADYIERKRRKSKTLFSHGSFFSFVRRSRKSQRLRVFLAFFSRQWLTQCMHR